MATSTTRTGNNGPVLCSQFSSGRFGSPRSSGSSPFAPGRSASPTRVNLKSSFKSPSSSVKFSIDRPGSPCRSISAMSRNQVVKKSGSNSVPSQKRTCMCSPTNHPGSFRCSMHKNVSTRAQAQAQAQAHSSSYPGNRLNVRTVEGDLMKRALLRALIRPSSQSQKRRGSFQPRPSRLSVMSKAEDVPLVVLH